MRRLTGDPRLAVGVGVEGNQPRGAADLAHDLVAGVDAQAAADAFELEAIADIDPGGADGDAGAAVDAVATTCPAIVLLVLAARLAAPVAIGDGEGLLVDHRRLDTRPWAHIGADLL